MSAFDSAGSGVVDRVRGRKRFGPLLREDTLGTVRVDDAPAVPDHARSFAALRADTAASAEIARYRRWFDKPVDRELVLALRTRDLPFVTRTMMELDSIYFAPVEWSGTMPHMNGSPAGSPGPCATRGRAGEMGSTTGLRRGLTWSRCGCQRARQLPRHAETIHCTAAFLVMTGTVEQEN